MYLFATQLSVYVLYLIGSNKIILKNVHAK